MDKRLIKNTSSVNTRDVYALCVYLQMVEKLKKNDLIYKDEDLPKLTEAMIKLIKIIDKSAISNSKTGGEALADPTFYPLSIGEHDVKAPLYNYSDLGCVDYLQQRIILVRSPYGYSAHIGISSTTYDYKLNRHDRRQFMVWANMEAIRRTTELFELFGLMWFSSSSTAFLACKKYIKGQYKNDVTAMKTIKLNMVRSSTK